MRCSRDRSAQLRRWRVARHVGGSVCAFPVLPCAKISNANTSWNVQWLGDKLAVLNLYGVLSLCFYLRQFVPPNGVFGTSTFRKQAALVWFEYPGISSLHGENRVPPPPTQPLFSETPLLFEGSQAWSVCLSATGSSENEYRALVKWYWQEKTEVPWEIPAPAQFVHHESHVLAWDRTRAYAVRGQRSWAMTRFPVNNGGSTFLPNGLPFSKEH